MGTFPAAEQLCKWTKKHEIYVSLNLCARDFADPHLLTVVSNALERADNLNPKYLKLEITESEGIDTKKQAEIIKSFDCKRFQGFYFSKPLPAEEFERLLTAGKLFDILSR